jgi:hypothetical protein
MDIPTVLYFYIKPSSISVVIRSAVLKEYFRKLTSNVEVLYPTQVHNGLLLCKSQRSKFQFLFLSLKNIRMIFIAEEKIFNMRHALSDGSIIYLMKLSRSLFQHSKCTIEGHLMQLNKISTSMQQALPFLHASGMD